MSASDAARDPRPHRLILDQVPDNHTVGKQGNQPGKSFCSKPIWAWRLCAYIISRCECFFWPGLHFSGRSSYRCAKSRLCNFGKAWSRLIVDADGYKAASRQELQKCQLFFPTGTWSDSWNWPKMKSELCGTVSSQKFLHFRRQFWPWTKPAVLAFSLSRYGDCSS